MLCLLSLITFAFVTKAQITENFNDGDYSQNPVWTPSSPLDWIINAGLQLQSNNQLANSTFYISTGNNLATVAEWELWMKIGFNPSSANYIDIFLTSSAANLSLTSATGYFVRVGSTNDDICLYRKGASGTITKIIDGLDGVLNVSSSTVKLKITRDINNLWTLSRDLTGTGNSYYTEGTVIDNTYNTSSFFGLLVKQSTSSFFGLHYFDEISVKPYVPDVTAPIIRTAVANSTTTLDVLFDEPLNMISAENITNYFVNNNIGTPATAVRDVTNAALVHLTFSQNFPNGPVCSLTVNNVTDVAGNALSNGTVSFSFYIPQQYDVVIDEIMADPTPQVALPAVEWLELKNVSLYAINLSGWKLAKATGSSGPMPLYILQPDSIVVLCTGSSVAELKQFGNVIAVTSFPSLTNEGDQISLRSPQNKIIHTINYSDSWYQNSLKKQGGWTLEMIDTKNPCSGITNWKASVDVSGGTPCKKNSVDGLNPDKILPQVLHAFAADKQTITVVFSEALDSLSASSIQNYSLSVGLNISAVTVVAPAFNVVMLTINSAPFIDSNKIYNVTVSSVTDCSGNTIGVKNNARFGLAAFADSNDIVINEILFNPASRGTDYLEIYNRSKKIFDLNKTFIASRNSFGVIGSIYPVTAETKLFFPEEYALLTTDTTWVMRNYFMNDPRAFLQMASLPSLPDDAGNAIILNAQGNVTDEINYSQKWHFKLIHDPEGVALERISVNEPSTESNFHSASTSAGYGTPGIKNSQYHPDEIADGEITVSPEVFSPDNDGFDDFATINYAFTEPGNIANITIFDASGRPVRYLQKNSLSGIKGNYRWDGLNGKQQKLPIGIYIIITETFNTEGKKRLYKNTIVLARKFD